MSDPNRQQTLIDALTVIAPLAQRLAVTARQQEQDAAALLDAARRAIDTVKQPSAIVIGSIVDSADARRQGGTVVALDAALDRAVVRWPDGDETALPLRHLTRGENGGAR